jgi:hypothetical protein
MKALCFILALISSQVAAYEEGCDEMVQFRDTELFDLFGVASQKYDAQKIELYREHKALLLKEIAIIKKDKPFLSADAALMLRLISTLSDRFIDLTSAVIPGGSTKAIGFGYATLKEVASGGNSKKLTYLIVKDGVISNLSTTVAGPLDIAISTGTLVHSLNKLDRNHKIDKAALDEVNQIIISIEKEVVKYDQLVKKLQKGKYDFIYLNNLKNWIDGKCNVK